MHSQSLRRAAKQTHKKKDEPNVIIGDNGTAKKKKRKNR